jgi:hypothetical protein
MAERAWSKVVCAEDVALWRTVAAELEAAAGTSERDPRFGELLRAVAQLIRRWVAP